ncbi:MAG: hypothetical protein V2I57_05355 [Xanthomonadales bacterium]|jgi:metal-responsive CopG/Arc/MetJ family transcriptional regulator|nr:hypothetical protein [Xanthomonadales bacterium]
MKVAVSIPDGLFEAAERLASERGLPRSQLYAEALEAYLAEHGPAVVTERLDAVYADHDAVLDDGLFRAQLEPVDDEAW